MELQASDVDETEEETPSLSDQSAWSRSFVSFSADEGRWLPRTRSAEMMVAIPITETAECRKSALQRTDTAYTVTDGNGLPVVDERGYLQGKVPCIPSERACSLCNGTSLQTIDEVDFVVYTGNGAVRRHRESLRCKDPGNRICVLPFYTRSGRHSRNCWHSLIDRMNDHIIYPLHTRCDWTCYYMIGTW